MKVNVMAIPKIRASNEERRELRPIGRNADKYSELLEELEDLAVFADQCGYDSMSTVEHHFHTEGLEMMPNWLLFSAKLAAKTKQMAFMPLSIVLPAHDPIRVAEDIALFDHMYPGRLQICFARGYQKRWMQTLMQRENASSSFTDKESDKLNREIFDEYLEIVLKALTEDAWNHDGKHYKVPMPFSGVTDWAGGEVTREFGADGELDEAGAVRKVGVVPAPNAKPYPDMFLPYSGSEQTLIDSAKRGFTALILESKVDGFREKCETYRDHLVKAGHTDAKLGQKVGAVRLIALGDSKEEALEHAANTSGWDFWNYFAKFGFMELFRTDEDPKDKFVSLKDKYEVAQRMYDTDHLLAGTPDEVSEQLEGLYRCHADGELEWLSWEFYAQGNVDLDEQKRQLELFAEKVRPRFP